MQNAHTSGREEQAELASYRVLIRQLPVTVRPALNDQLAEWDTLFPFERRRMQNFMRGLASFSPSALDALVAPMRKLESRMGVEHWDFTEATNTMENASLLARSALYAEWRDQVQRIYIAVESAAHASAQPVISLPRLAVAVLPNYLPFERTRLWQKWGEHGIEVSINGDAANITYQLLQGPGSIPNSLSQQNNHEISNLWLIDAGSRPPALTANTNTASTLNYVALNELRERVLAQVNTVPKSITATDQTLAAIRSESWDPWWPAELKDQPILRKFVINLYLSGNGALIFSNAFVEWAASEAIRRARPRVMFARFGLRAKPKPFTGIAIFENQQRISALPDIEDPQGSAEDALVLARYVLLSAQRYPESAQTAFLCIAESAQSACLILPDAFKESWTGPRSVTPQQLSDWVVRFLATQPKSYG